MPRLLLIAALTFLSLGRVCAETAGALAERFALADDREAVVASLVPGTEDHFLYRCLLWQHQGRLAEVATALVTWQARFGDSPLRQRIRLRQALLVFGEDPARGGEHLAQVLELPNATRTQVGAGAGVDQPLMPVAEHLSWAAISAAAARSEGLTGWSEAGIERIIGDLRDGDQRRLALARLPAHHPAAVASVIADLAHRGADFGSLPIHRWLTLEQLAACRTARPEVAEDADFVLISLRAMWAERGRALPPDEPLERGAWIAALAAFAEGLPASAAPLRRYLDLQRLRLDVARGQVEAAWLASVLARSLPAKAGLRAPRATTVASGDLPSAEIIAATRLGESPDAPALIDEALELVLAGAPDSARFAEVMAADELHRLFIRAKLLSGVGDPAQWLANAADSDFGTRLRDQVELRFAGDRPSSFAGDAAVVVLPLLLKNVPNLLVRIFALDAVNVGRQTRSPPSVTLDLSGVAPTSQRSLSFAHSPIVRHRELLALPECDGPGWWIIELVGGGQVARAVVQKGALRFHRVAARDGDHLFISDEADRPVPDAVAWLDGQRFSAGTDGGIRLPFAADQRQVDLIITGADRALVAPYQTRAESWNLSAKVLLDREQVIGGTTATMLLRPCLELCGTRMDFAALQDAAVEITTRTAAGSLATTRITEFVDPDHAETVIRFPVPERVDRIEIALRGHLRNHTAGREEALAWSSVMHVNQDQATERIRDMQLERDAQGWFIACRGLNGEALAKVEIALRLEHRFLSFPLGVRVRTGDDGRADLGPLDDVIAVSVDRGRVRASLADDPRVPRPDRRRFAPLQEAAIPARLTALVGDVVRLPISGTSPAPGVRDWLIRKQDGEAAAADVTAHSRRVAVGAAALLEITGLTPGSYRIFTPAGASELLILAGQRRAGMVFTGEGIVRADPPAPLGVHAERVAAGLAIQVLNASATTRVQVIGRRFQPIVPQLWSWWPETAMERTSAWPLAQYLDGRPLDDELRYILARAQAEHHPGVMLERPGLVLNPWHDDHFMVTGAAGAETGMSELRSGGGKHRAVSRHGGSRASERSHGVAIDYLAGPGVVLANLIPDAAGRVEVDVARLGAAQQVLVVATDADSAVSTTLALPPRPLPTRERRLLQGLPVTEHLVYERTAQVMPPAMPLVARDGALQRRRVIASVADLFALYRTLAPDLELGDFLPLANWASLDERARREFYGRFASHELNLFLWHKDRAFFAAVVRPHLRNKLQKTFIDRWLLEEDLSTYLVADRHHRLNLCERVLLARRIGGAFLQQERASLEPFFAELREGEYEAFDQATEQCLAGMPVAQAPAAAPAVEQAEKEDRIFPPGAVAGRPKAQNATDDDGELGDAAPPIVQFFQDQPATAAYIEQNWYGVTWSDQQASLITGNGFWRDLLAWDGDTPFLSANALLATGNRSELLAALALSDLPLVARDTNVAGQPRTLATSSLLLREEARPAALAAGDLMVHQHLYLVSEASGRGARARPVAGDLHPGTPYVVMTVAINASAHQRNVTVLAQIPTGAVPILDTSPTVGRTINLAPYAHTRIEQAFYFPATGVAAHFPAHVRADATVVAALAPVSWPVVPLKAGEATQWFDTSDETRLLAHLDAAEADLDLSPLAWRYRSRAFWDAVVTRLERRHRYDADTWSHAIRHGDAARAAVWLRSQDEVLQRLGRTFSSRWLTIAALGDGGFIHADLTPVTNARAHRTVHPVGNPLVSGAYAALVERLCCEPQLGATSRLELAYALMLQDRHGEASAQHQRIVPADAPARMAYDYLGAYLALGRGDVAAAIASVTPWKDHAVERWRLRFAEVLAQGEEIAGRPVQREAALVQAHRQAALAAATPSFQAKLHEANTIVITAHNLAACSVRFHRMDLEPLFSLAPFSVAAPERLVRVRPDVELTVPIGADGKAEVTVPEGLRHQPLAIQISAGGQQQVLTSFADALDLRLSPASGQVQVFDARTGKPLAAAYVKVYAKREGVVFHKDGYTDLRGRFDYVTLGSKATAGVTAFALFVQHPEAGSTVREVSPP